MVLEATVVCLDNSEWMRNGDYQPTRLEAQHDAVSMVCGSKIQSNPENTVAAMTMAGKCDMVVTLTGDLGKILTCIGNIKVNGSLNILTALQIAQLALKHRQNKHQRQRIVVFVGSPLDTEERDLVKVAKKLKKNNVAVDVINFGEDEHNTAKLEAFVNAVNSKDGNSHLVSIPPGPHLLSDVLVSSPVVASEGMTGSGAGDSSQFEFGVDPSLDPELAMALRMSLEEEQMRQERARREAEESQRAQQNEVAASTNISAGTQPSGISASTEDSAATQPSQAPEGKEQSTPMAVDGAAAWGDGEGLDQCKVDDEQALLAQAIALSMQTGGSGDDVMAGNLSDPVDMPSLSEEQQIEMAMRMSMMGASGSEEGDRGGDMDVTQNKEFLSSVLGDLPGVDPNDEAIRSLMGGLSEVSKPHNEEDEEEKDKNNDKPKDNKG